MVFFFTNKVRVMPRTAGSREILEYADLYFGGDQSNAINTQIENTKEVNDVPGGSLNPQCATNKNSTFKKYVDLAVNFWATEHQAVTHEHNYIRSADVLALRRQHNVVASPSQILCPVEQHSDGSCSFGPEHLTLEPKAREIVGRVVGSVGDTPGIAGVLNINKDRRPNWNGGLLTHGPTIGRHRAIKRRTLRVMPANQSGAWVEYGPVWAERGHGWYLDIPMLRLSKKEFLALARKWDRFTADEKTWWVGYDHVLAGVMCASGRRKVMRYAYNQLIQPFGAPARVTDLMHRLPPLGRIGHDQIGFTHTHSFPIFDKLGRACAALGEKIGEYGGRNWVGVFAAVGLLLAGFYHARSKATAIVHFMQFLQSVPLTGAQVDTIAHRMKTELERRDEIQGARRGVGVDQGLNDYVAVDKLLPVAGTVIILAIMGIATRALPGDRAWTETLTRFASMGRVLSSFEAAQRWGTKFGDILQGTVATYIYGAPEGVFDQMKLMNDWCDRVAALATTDFESRIQTDKTLRPDVDKLIKEGSDLSLWLTRFKVDREYTVRFYRMQTVLYTLRAKAAEGNPTAMKMRPVPLLVHYVGDTGCGKSTMIDSICIEILAEMGLTGPNVLEEYVYYYKPSKDGFWSGWHDAIKIIVCDDMFCLKDVPGCPSEEALHTIAMANTAPMQLTMADIASKGNMWMNAEVILWTTNRRDYKFDSLTNEEAVWNRVDLQYRVNPKPEYEQVMNIRGKQVKTLDRKKIRPLVSADPGTATTFTNYTRLDPKCDADEMIGDTCDFDAMCEEVLKHLHEKEEMFIDIKKARAVFMERAIARRAKGVDETDRKCEKKTVEQVQAELDQLPVPGCSHELVGHDQMFARVPWVTRTEGWWYRRYHIDALAYYMRQHRVPEGEIWLGMPVGLEELPCIIVQDVNVLQEDIDRLVTNALRFGTQRALDEFVRAAAGKEVSVAICACTRERMAWAALGAHFEICRDRARRGLENGVPEEAPCDYKLGGNWPAVIALIAVIGVAIGVAVWYLVQRWRSGGENECDGVDGDDEAYNTTDKGAKVGKVEATKGKDEALVDGNAYELANKVQKNLYTLQKKIEGEWDSKLQVFFVFGRIAVTNRHLIRALRTGTGETEWRIISQHNPKGFVLKQSQLNIGYDKDEGSQLKDLMLVEFPVCVPQHADLRKHIIDRVDMSKFTSVGRVTLVTHGVRAQTPTITIKTSDRLEAHDTWFSALHEEDGKAYKRMRTYYQYGCDTERGECGGVLIVNDPAFTKKIIGIHSGGIADRDMPAIGQPVCIEAINNYMSRMTIRRPDSVVPLTITGTDEMNSRPEEFAGHSYMGLDERPVFCNGKSNIHPSVVADVLWEPKTKPAYLHPFVRGDVRCDPMRMARDKVLTDGNPILNEEVLSVCSNDVSQMIAEPDIGVERRVMTWEEAIVGIVGDELYPPLNRRTSPGYGWSKSGGGKAQYFGRDEKYILDDPRVIAKRDEYMDRLRRGERLCVKWEDSLKDERRPIEKVDAGKTRMFSVGCQVFTVIFRQYFMAFVAQVTKGRIDNEIAVGTNVYSFDWDKIACRMRSKGVDVLAGDFSNYDGTLNAEIMWRVLDVVDAFYDDDEETRRIRRLLWCDIVYSIHVNGKHCYMWTHSNPSGCPITTILNSVYHCIAVRYVFVQCAREAGLLGTMKTYRNVVAFVCYGDDDMWNIADQAQGWLNMETITAGFKRLGMMYTDETKSENPLGFRKLEEVKFLKREFRFDEESGRVRAPLDIDVVKEMPRWIRGRRNEWELAAEVLEEAAEELAQHDRATFDSIMPHFKEAQRILSRRVPCRLDTYDGYQWALSERARK